MAQLRLRRTSDGALSVVGDVPGDHYFSAQWIADRVAEGTLSVTVTLNTADGPVTWQLAGLEGEDGGRNPVSWHVRTED